MHCELIVPGLLPAGADAAAALAGLRLPALELLLARGRRTSDASASLESWLMEAFEGDGDEEIPAGALTFAASGGAAGDAAWMRADPAHLKLNRDELVLVPASAFGVQAAEAQALCETLNAHFSRELTFFPIGGERWCVRIDGGAADGLRTKTPAEVAGHDINRHLPSGEGAMRWHGRLNEIQMLLHEHPVNEAREARGEPAVNSVWLWGAGPMPADLAAPFQSVTADDALALGLAAAAGLRHRPLPANASAWLERLPEDGRQLLVLDSLRLPLALGDFEGWQSRIEALEKDWFAPLVESLKSGRIGMLTVLVPDGGELRAFEAVRQDLRKFWRRPKPLAVYLHAA